MGFGCSGAKRSEPLLRSAEALSAEETFGAGRYNRLPSPYLPS